MQLPPPIPFINTGYTRKSDEEEIIKEYTYLDPTDGKPLISAAAAAEFKRASEAYENRGIDEEMADAIDDLKIEKSHDGESDRSNMGAIRYSNAMNTDNANSFAAVRKRPGRASRLPRRDPHCLPASLFHRASTTPDINFAENAQNMGQQAYYLPVEIDEDPSEVVDGENMHQDGGYGETIENYQGHTQEEAYYAGTDYHSHSALLANSRPMRDFKEELKRKRYASVLSPSHTSGPFAAPGTTGVLPVREEVDNETRRMRKRNFNTLMNPDFLDGQAKEARELRDEQDSAERGPSSGNDGKGGKGKRNRRE